MEDAGVGEIAFTEKILGGNSFFMGAKKKRFVMTTNLFSSFRVR